MGKVLKTILVIAIAAGIAYFAPFLATHAFGLVAGTLGASAAAAGIGAVLSIAATAVMSALTSSPHTSTAPGLQPSRGQPMTAVGFRYEYPPDPAVRSASPIRERWWRDKLFAPWDRLAITRMEGTCMVPMIPAGRNWAVVERDTAICAGDLCLFRPDDIAAYLRASGFDPRNSGGLVKRFVGIDPERRVMVYETTNPPNRAETGIDRIQHLHRVRSWHPSWWVAVRARWSTRHG